MFGQVCQSWSSGCVHWTLPCSCRREEGRGVRKELCKQLQGSAQISRIGLSCSWHHLKLHPPAVPSFSSLWCRVCCLQDDTVLETKPIPGLPWQGHLLSFPVTAPPQHCTLHPLFLHRVGEDVEFLPQDHQKELNPPGK